MQLDLSLLKPAPKKFRVRPIKPGYVKELEALIADAPAWPFPPITVRALPRKAVGKDTKGAKKFGPQLYEVLDGNNRWRAAAGRKMKTIPAQIVAAKTQAAAFTLAILENLEHGLHLDKDERDEAIRTLHVECKVGQGDIVKKFKLSKASVSRICARKQRTGAPRRKAAKTEPSAREAGSGFAPAQYFKELHALAAEYIDHADEVTAFIGEHEIKPLPDDFTQMVLSLTKE